MKLGKKLGITGLEIKNVNIKKADLSYLRGDEKLTEDINRAKSEKQSLMIGLYMDKKLMGIYIFALEKDYSLNNKDKLSGIKGIWTLGNPYNNAYVLIYEYCPEDFVQFKDTLIKQYIESTLTDAVDICGNAGGYVIDNMLFLSQRRQKAL